MRDLFRPDPAIAMVGDHVGSASMGGSRSTQRFAQILPAVEDLAESPGNVSGTATAGLQHTRWLRA